MAKVIYQPSTHDCYAELRNDLGPENKVTFGTIAECSCGSQYKLGNDQRDGNYWSRHLAKRDS